MTEQEAENLRQGIADEIAEFPIGCKVEYMYMPGSVGEIVDVERPDFLLLGVRFKVKWLSHPSREGVGEVSGWLSPSDLKRV